MFSRPALFTGELLLGNGGAWVTVNGTAILAPGATFALRIVQVTATRTLAFNNAAPIEGTVYDSIAGTGRRFVWGATGDGFLQTWAPIAPGWQLSPNAALLYAITSTAANEFLAYGIEYYIDAV